MRICMRQILTFIFASLVAFASGPEFFTAERELLIKWKGGPNSEQAGIGSAAIGGTVKRNFSAIGWQLVRLPEGMSVSEGLAKYRAHPEVLLVEANGQVHFQTPPLAPSDSEASEPSFRATATPGTITP